MKKSRQSMLEAVRHATILTEQAAAGMIPNSVAVGDVARVVRQVASRKSKVRTFLEESGGKAGPTMTKKAGDLMVQLEQCELQLNGLNKQLKRTKRNLAFDTTPNYLASPREFGKTDLLASWEQRPRHMDGSHAVIELPYIHIEFQHGATSEAGSNGCQIEDVLNAVIDHIEQFESGPLNCEENRIALMHLNKAVEALIDRRSHRANQGILGTMEPHDSTSILTASSTS